jgi:hypothetical protein
MSAARVLATFKVRREGITCAQVLDAVERVWTFGK